MWRWTIVVTVLVIAGSRLSAQDMALSQILVDGKTWQRMGGESLILKLRIPQTPGVEKPSCIVYSPDGGTAFVSSEIGTFIWAFRVEKDGSLSAGQPYCALRVPRGEKNMPVKVMAVDAVGRIFAPTSIGIQVFDPTGRLCGVIDNPPGGPVTDMDCKIHGTQLCVFNDAPGYIRELKQPPQKSSKPGR